MVFEGLDLKAIVFDFDDTLVHTYQMAYVKHVNTARTLGLRIPSEKEYLKWYGLPWIELVRNLWPSVSFDQFKNTHVQGKNEDFPLVQGVTETLAYCKQQKLLLGLLTTRDKFSLSMVSSFDHLNLNYFDFVFTRSNTGYHKPDPRVFNEVLSKLSARGISKTNTLYVGDSMYDFMAAERAGLRFLASLTGPAQKEDLLNAGLDENHLLPSVKALPEKLKSLGWLLG